MLNDRENILSALREKALKDLRADAARQYPE